MSCSRQSFEQNLLNIQVLACTLHRFAGSYSHRELLHCRGASESLDFLQSQNICSGTISWLGEVSKVQKSTRRVTVRPFRMNLN
jgi:hypothetical protein